MNLNIWQIIFLGLMQGVSELFPISSLGHTVIIPGLLGWGDIEQNNSFLPLLTALHLGTAIALVIYFWRDWLQVLRSVGRSIKDGEVKKGSEEWVSFLIIIGCVPAGILGVFLQNPLKALFASPLLAATFLIVNGSILFLGERLRLRAESRALQASEGSKASEALFRPLSALTWNEAIIVGLGQALALIPGISRSGTSMVAGLGVRLNHEDAARFSFLLGTPLIAGAALIEVPQLNLQDAHLLLIVGVGVVVAGVAAFLSTKFLMKYFETGSLYPFAYYCWGAGLISLIILVAVLHAQV
jgi:undecaprenyl-diphosphatase